jgi:DNA-directed RNA polymerase subunit K/omega
MFRNVAPWMLVLVFLAISLAAVGSVLFLVLGGGEPVWGSINVLEIDARGESRAELLRKKLEISVNLDKGIDASTPLKDAIEFLSDRYDLTMLIDSKAFEAIGVQKVEEQPVQLPKMVGVSMRTVLRLLLAQIKGDMHHGTFIVQDDVIFITTSGHLFQGDATQDPLLPLISAPTIDTDTAGKPLLVALRDIADHSGVNILIDPRVGDKSRRPVTATLNHVPVDTAVRLLADMAGLRSVVMDNVIYVTSPENAKELQVEANARAERRKKAERGPLLPGDDSGKMEGK